MYNMCRVISGGNLVLAGQCKYFTEASEVIKSTRYFKYRKKKVL